MRLGVGVFVQEGLMGSKLSKHYLILNTHYTLGITYDPPCKNICFKGVPSMVSVLSKDSSFGPRILFFQLKIV